MSFFVSALILLLLVQLRPFLSIFLLELIFQTFRHPCCFPPGSSVYFSMGGCKNYRPHYKRVNEYSASLTYADFG